MKCKQCNKTFADELGSCPYCSTLPKKVAQKLGTDFISRLFSGDLVYGTPFGDRYEIEELVGRGGMGIVYRAKDKILHETVAIKLLNPLFSSDEEIIVRFKQEIKLARKINHKNVIHIYDIGEVEGIRYISMEFVQGKDLKEVIRAEGGGLPLNVGILIIQKIAEALQVAHDLGIIHRDIKPQNILIQPNSEVKILDFGIARLADADDVTRTGSLLGSPVYMSPEQATGKDTDHRTDIYSFGVIMFEIFTGRIPFLADTPIATALKHVNEPPPLPSTLNPDIPVWVEKVILRAMEKDPADRFQRALDIIDPVRGLHVDRITDTDIIVCPFCGKHNPGSHSSCSNCHSFLGREPQSDLRAQVDTQKIKDVRFEERKLMKSATLSFASNDYLKAKEDLELLLVLNSENIKAQRMLEVIESKILLEKKVNLYHQNALISFQDKKYDEAVTLWEKIKELDPEKNDVDDFLKKAKSAQGVYNRIKGFINKGLQAYNQNDYQQAISLWEKVIEIDPKNVEAVFYIAKTQTLLNYENRCQNLQNQAEIFIRHREYAKAIECLEQFLKLDQENIGVQLKLDELREFEAVNSLLEEGLRFYQGHEYEQAISCWEKVFVIDSENEDARHYIIQAKAKLNETIKVKEIFRSGLVCYRNKEWEAAIAQFEDVRKFEGLYQGDAITYIDKARQRLEKENSINTLLAEALKTYQQEHQDLARKIESLSTAIKQWEKVLEIEPDHAEATEYITKAKLIIQRSKLLVASREADQSPSVSAPKPAASPSPAAVTPKTSKKGKKISLFSEIREYVIGAVLGGAIGDALGVGNSWVAHSSEDIELVQTYQPNQIGRFRDVPPGEMSGELDLVFKTTSLMFNGKDIKPKDILQGMIKQSKKLISPLEKNTEGLFNNLMKGVPWKDAVLVTEDDFSPLYRSALAGCFSFHDEDRLVNQVKTLVQLTHKNQKVLACSMATAYAVSFILDFRNSTLKGLRTLIGGGDTLPIPLWDNSNFIKAVSQKAEEYDPEIADQIRELLIYSSMPSDRFFDTVGISDKAEETMLSAFFCFLKHYESFSDSVILAINSRGSSRHITGNRHGIACLTGFLGGACNGFIQIPHFWINEFIQKDAVFTLANQITDSCPMV